jgi:DNA-binding NarL/FixJ family response regulator
MSISARRCVRVLIVSSQPIVRAGLAAVLRPFRTRVRVVGEVDGVDAARAEAARSQPHILLFDADLGDTEGLDQVAHLVRAFRGCRVVVLARRDESRFTWLVLQRGAAGFLLETVGGAELAAALEEVGGGGVAVDSALAGGPRVDPEQPPAPPWPGAQLGLTEQESQILELLAQGEQSAGVSRHLGISAAEVKARVRSAYRHLHARDRSDALARLAREGLFS